MHLPFGSHDSTAGYQITQQTAPLAIGGELTLFPSEKKLRLTRVQLEQDSGKSQHGFARDEGGSMVPSMTVVDLNRAGVALIELVFEPDLRSPCLLLLLQSKSIGCLPACLRHCPYARMPICPVRLS